MGKSEENPNGTVFMLDDKDTIMRKFKRAVTDSDTDIRMDGSKPGISNLLTIYAAFNDITESEAESKFAGSTYSDFKTAVGETVADKLGKIQADYKRIREDKQYLESVMKDGTSSASAVANKTLSKVMRKVGFLR